MLRNQDILQIVNGCSLERIVIKKTKGKDRREKLVLFGVSYYLDAMNQDPKAICVVVDGEGKYLVERAKVHKTKLVLTIANSIH